jgi:hypothetical protein
MAANPELEQHERNLRIAARIKQIVDYAFFLIYTIIAVEIVLELAAARERNAFKRFMDTISAPFLEWFDGLFRDPAYGEYRVMYSYIAGLVFWIIVHIAIRGLIRVLGPRPAP